MERLVSYLNITRTHCPRQKNDPRGISEMLSQTMGAAAWARPAERGEGEAGSLSPAQPRGPRVRALSQGGLFPSLGLECCLPGQGLALPGTRWGIPRFSGLWRLLSNSRPNTRPQAEAPPDELSGGQWSRSVTSPRCVIRARHLSVEASHRRTSAPDAQGSPHSKVFLQRQRETTST